MVGDQPDGVDDAVVRGAPAEVAAHPFADLRIGERHDSGSNVLGDRARPTGCMFRQHPDRRADLAGRAVAALEAIELDEGRLHGMEDVAIGEPLHGCHFPTVELHGKAEARVDPLTVDQHGAGAAGTLIAALLRACQFEVLAQRVEQAHSRFKQEFG